ncbi:MAG: cupin domain-containing protein [Chloroflexi bacterium]|nr:cupin domain-containing protein [Chloroflexota bacterium]
MPIKVLRLESETEEVRLTSDGGARVRRWRELGARLASMDYLTLQPRAQPLDLWYPAAEDSYYVIEGHGTVVDLQRDRAQRFGPGKFVHAPAGLPHRLQATGVELLVLVGGPCPPVPNAFDQPSAAATSAPAEGELSVLDLAGGVEIPLIRPPMPGGYARFPIWPGMGARLRSMNRVAMRPGQENVPHVHPVSEDIFYCLSGTCVVEDGSTGREQPFGRDCLIFIDPGTPHAVRSLGPDDYISVGGPCPPDLDAFRRFGLG